MLYRAKIGMVNCPACTLFVELGTLRQKCPATLRRTPGRVKYAAFDPMFNCYCPYYYLDVALGKVCKLPISICTLFILSVAGYVW